MLCNRERNVIEGLCLKSWKKVIKKGNVVQMYLTKVDMSSIYRVRVWSIEFPNMNK